MSHSKESKRNEYRNHCYGYRVTSLPAQLPIREENTLWTEISELSRTDYTTRVLFHPILHFTFTGASSRSVSDDSVKCLLHMLRNCFRLTLNPHCRQLNLDRLGKRVVDVLGAFRCLSSFSSHSGMGTLLFIVLPNHGYVFTFMK